MRHPYTWFFLLLLLPFTLWAQLRIQLQSIPADTPEDATIYIAGNFNNWDAGSEDYQLTANGEGVLEITILPDPGTLEFKFTRGSWETVEGTREGNFRPNRTYDYAGGAAVLQLNIDGWEGQRGEGGTAADNVSILSREFYMPELNRYRRIWIYLPPDYNTSERCYPTLYMHDGQNLFDRTTSFSGEWEVDESLNRLFAQGDQGVIVVGVDNGGNDRIAEYTPWPNPQYGGGQGDTYVDFIVNTLKPHIDQQYRSCPERLHTGIMGSSLGGLISLYAAVEHQDVFSKAGVFSPSLWFSSDIYTHVSEIGKQADMRIYLLGGERESESMLPDLNAMYNTLRSAGYTDSELQVVTHPDGQHSEWYWAREFPAAYQWLFAADNTTDTREEDGLPLIRLTPNPAAEVVRIEGTVEVSNPLLQIFSVDGRVILPPTVLRGDTFNSSFLRPGLYIFIIRDGSQLIGSQRLLITDN